MIRHNDRFTRPAALRVGAGVCCVSLVVLSAMVIGSNPGSAAGLGPSALSASSAGIVVSNWPTYHADGVANGDANGAIDLSTTYECLDLPESRRGDIRRTTGPRRSCRRGH